MGAMRQPSRPGSAGNSIRDTGRSILLSATLLAGGADGIALARQCEVPNWQQGYESAVGIDRLPGTTAVLDHDGDGVPTLFAANSGGAMGGTAIRGLARWTGSSWQQFGPAFSGFVVRMLLHDLDGDGVPSLVLAGFIQLDDGGPRRGLIAWNGSDWTALSDVPASGPFMKDIASVDVDGDGVATLFATRQERSSIDDVHALVRWEGGAWIVVDPARTVSLFGGAGKSGRLVGHDDDGDGIATLYAAVDVSDASGSVAVGLARFDGGALSAPSTAETPALVRGRIKDMLSGDLDSDGVPDLVIAGQVTGFPVPAGASGVVVLEGGAWSVPGSVLTLANGGVDSVATINDVVYADDDGDGAETLFATGWFDKAGAVPISNIARFDAAGGGAGWVALGAGLSAGGTAIEGIRRSKSADEIVVFGNFMTAGSNYARGSARWNGNSWGALGAMAPTRGVDSAVFGSTLFDHDGDGAKSVVAAGQYRLAGTTEAQGIALFDGAQWISLGGLPAWTGGATAALAADLDGDGVETLYVAGTDGLSVNGIAAFVPAGSGGSWVQLGGNLAQRIDVLLVADHDADGVSELLAAGRPPSPAAPTVLRWTGSSWVALPGALTGADAVNDLIAFDDDGDGHASLFAALGRNDPNVVLNRVRKWSAGSWTTVGAITSGHVFRLQALDHDGDGVASLAAFGGFRPNGSIALSLVMTLSGGNWSSFGPTTMNTYWAGCWMERFYDDGDGTASMYLSIFDPYSAQYGTMMRLEGGAWTEIASEIGYGLITHHEVDLDRDGAASMYLFGLTRALPGACGSSVGEIEQCIAPCIADIDGDGEVGGRDMTAVLSAWGACGSASCDADLDRNGEVGAGDLAALVAAWGVCR